MPMILGQRDQQHYNTVKKIDTVYQKVVLNSKTGLAGQNKTIDFSDIITITGESVDKIDRWFE